MNREQYEKFFKDQGDIFELLQFVGDEQKFNDQIIENRLKDFYEDNADWNKNLDKYYSSEKFKSHNHQPKSIDEIQEISVDDIYGMIKEEEEFQKQISKCQEMLKEYDDDRENKKETIIDIAKIMGIYPSENKGLFQHYVDLENIKKSEKELHKEILEKDEVMRIPIDGILRDFIDNLNTGTGTGMIIQQRKGKNLYRGEAGYYGTSRPIAYRKMNNRIPSLIFDGIQVMKELEGIGILKGIDAFGAWDATSHNIIATCQHYGQHTRMMDLTGDIKVALFFACCKVDKKDMKWSPLTKDDFEKKQYGILYRASNEIIKMRDVKNKSNIRRPFAIGYQPFRRCAAQNGYGIIGDSTYDMLQDELFEKYKFLHTEEFCRWIFDEMDQGNKIYPEEDVPNLFEYFNEINRQKVISKWAFDWVADYCEATEEEKTLFKQNLLQECGYKILDYNKEYIPYNKLKKINKKYPPSKAYSQIDTTELKPIFAI